MEADIERVWSTLYTNNPKIQAFAVARGSTIVWQTSNWDLVSEAESLVNAPSSAASSVKVNGLTYRRVVSGPEFYVSTADRNQGHFLMALVDGSTWLMAWATADSAPDLTVVDLGRAAISLIGKV